MNQNNVHEFKLTSNEHSQNKHKSDLKFIAVFDNFTLCFLGIMNARIL